jgi:hypothetical protein
MEKMMGESITSSQTPIENIGTQASESVAGFLERKLDDVIRNWLARVEKDPDLTAISLTFQERTGHLPQLLHDVILRLRLDEDSKAPISEAAAHMAICGAR